MTQHSPPCPLCAADSRHALTAGDRNRETTDERFAYNRCNACATLFMVDVPSDLARYYAGDYHLFGPDGEPQWTHSATLLDVESFRMGMLRGHVQGNGALIDIGAGPGAFVAAAKREGFDVTAVEMDARCCGYMRERLGVRAICSDQPIAALQGLAPAQAITLWHSLEHLRDPAAMLAAAAERLADGGVLAIGVPNPDSLQFRLLGARWPHLDAPRHLTLMPARALVAHARTLGLRCVESTTDDPFARVCNIHGWAYALRRRPAAGPASPAVGQAAGVIAKLAAPIERSDKRGAALTVLLQKPPAGAATSP
jgi:2-polyprenyl-3-methyl-5-hydroxy-6-metoxy-1,4-benzoquinol methylase